MNDIKIACMHWHNTISPELYRNLLDQTNTIPEIRCNFNREKYSYIALWLYLSDAFYNIDEEDLIYEHGEYIVMCFKERLEYLRRIVIRGMSHHQSYNLYLQYILNDNQLNLDGVRVNLNYDSALYGNAYAHSNTGIDKIKQFSFAIEQGTVADFKKDVRMDEGENHSDCPICYENITEACVVLGCTHHVCASCFVTYLNTRNHAINCVVCRASIQKVKTYDEEFMDKLKTYVSPNDEDDLENTHHVPERFEDGDNIVINLV
jgi:hypothetical protein